MSRVAKIGGALLVLLLAAPAWAQTCTNVGTGNWGTAATWTCTAPAGSRVPTNADNVVIINNSTVTVNIAGAVAGSVTINSGANATSLTLGGAGTSLTVTNAGGRSGNVVINGPTAAVTKQISVGARSLTVTGSVTINGGSTTASTNNIAQLAITSGTATIGGLTITGGTINSRARTTITTGTLTVNGNATVASGNLGAALLQLTGAGTVSVTGSLSVSTTASTNNTGDATVEVTNAGGLLAVTGAATVTGGGAADRDALLRVTVSSNAGRGITVGGDLNINATVAGSSSVTLGTGSRMTVAGAVTNRDTLNIGAGIFTMTGAAATLTTGNVAIAATTTVTTGTLTVAGNVVVDALGVGASLLTLSNGVISISGALSVTAASATNDNGDATARVTGTGRIDITGNVTVTGGSNANRDALLQASGASASGQGINIGGTLTINSTVSASSSVTLGTGSRITVTGAGGVLNSDTLSVGAGIFTMSNSAATLTTRNNAIPATTSVSTGTLSVAGNAVVDSGSLGLGRLVVSGTGSASIGGNLEVTTASSTGNAGDATAEVTNAGGLLAVTGNATVTGGGANNRDALLRVTVTSNAGRGITVGGNLNVDATVAGSSTVTLGTGSLMTVSGSVSNNDTVTVGAGTLTVTGDYTNVNRTFAVSTTVSTGTLTVGGTLTNSATETLSISSTGIVNANGNFVNSGTFTNTAAGQLFLRGATSTINGTFTRGTGTVTLNGSSAQALSGSALTPPTTAANGFNNLVINNSAGVTLSGNVVAKGVITFTAGEVTTGSNLFILERSCVGGTSRTGGHVVGNFQMLVPAGASTCTFDIGSAGAYTPVAVTFNGVSGAGGRLIARIGSPVSDHPNLATSGLNTLKSVNRWWELTTTGVLGTALPTFTNYSATMTFINPGDMDSGADTAVFAVERYNGSIWSVTTAGARTTTSTQATGITALGILAVGEKKSSAPGSFNAFETATGATAVTGVIKTRVSGTTFSLDVVAISAGAKLASFSDTVKVELLGNTALGISLDANNCPVTSTVLQTVSPNPTIASGRSTVNFAAVANAWRDVRVRISWPVTTPTVTSCSTDNFAIRPNAITGFAVSDNNRTTAGTTRTLNSTAFGAVVHNAGRPLSVRGSAVNGAGSPAVTTNYTGTPTATMTACGPGAGFEACTSGFGTLTLGTNFVSGSLSTDVATYSDVGSFNLQLIDDDFAQVDGSDGSTLSERRVQSAVITVGRFVPDHFAVGANVPVFTPACGAFTYIGQTFNFSTQPVITVTAQDAGNNTTTRYAGNWWRLTNSSVTPATQAARYAAASGTLDLTALPAVSGDPQIRFNGDGQPSPPAAGTGTLTFSGGSGFTFTRNNTTPNAPFDADIALTLNVIDADGVTYASNPVNFGSASAGNGITFSDGNAGTTTDKAMRYGRLRLVSSSGTQTLPLLIPVQAQYWNGSAFLLNTLDSCTALAASNIGLGGYTQQLSAGETTATLTATTLQAGRTSVRLSAPGTGNYGGVDVTLNLGAAATADACPALTPSATAGNKTYLRGRWCGATATKDPAARARFGVRRGVSNDTVFTKEQ